jgi:glycosyltransferase involved in cell wall biosynthesis
LIVHRIPFQRWEPGAPGRPHPGVEAPEARALFASPLRSQCFSWQACLLAERLVEEAEIDLIEAQEYEAPLYFFQLRRALGAGPKRRPPCIVHLHSPSESIGEHNDWAPGLPALVVASRLEGYSIRAADALLAPSRFLAREVERRYTLPSSTEVIPYPADETPLLDRSAAVWQGGGLLYVGRLEPRKGVLEWIDAAVAVAREDDDARFDFVGRNDLGPTRALAERTLQDRIPDDLRGRFRFHGAHPRDTLDRFLAAARIAVVPSRWDNLPYTCVEAMMTGLPVLTTPAGGMAELVVDGESGWIAAAATPRALEEALRRALSARPSTLAAMGQKARARILELCDPARIVGLHRRFRAAVVDSGPERSLTIPPHLPGARSRGAQPAVRPTGTDSRRGIAVVVPLPGQSELPSLTKASLEGQSHRPVTVEIARYGRDIAAAKNSAVESILALDPKPAGVAFLGPGDRLLPGFVARCEETLRWSPQVGIVSCWVRDDRSRAVATPPCPAFPYQWLWNDVASCSVVRTEALEAAGGFRAAFDFGYEAWDLWNAVMAQGWAAVTLPEILGETAEQQAELEASSPPGRGMRSRIVRRFPELVGGEGEELALLARPASGRLLRDALGLLAAHFAASAALGRAAGRSAETWPRRSRGRLRALLYGWLSRAASRLLLGEENRGG